MDKNAHHDAQDNNDEPQPSTSGTSGNPADIAEEPEAYVVESILDKREASDGSIEYLIKWLGYPDSECTWEPEANCACPKLIAAFERKRRAEAKRLSAGQSPKGRDRITKSQSTPGTRSSGRRSLSHSASSSRAPSSQPSTSSVNTSSPLMHSFSQPSTSNNCDNDIIATDSACTYDDQSEKQADVQINHNGNLQINDSTNPQTIDLADTDSETGGSLEAMTCRMPSTQSTPVEDKTMHTSLINDEDSQKYERAFRMRQLSLDQILGAVKSDECMKIVVKWRSIDQPELMPIDAARNLYPQELITFLLDRIKWL